jgi:ammonia channel protein AmtB
MRWLRRLTFGLCRNSCSCSVTKLKTWQIGIIGAVAANFATSLKYYMGIDESLDIFAIHAVGGVVGTLLNGIFADKNIAALDGFTVIQGGWVNRHVSSFADLLAWLIYQSGFKSATKVRWLCIFLPAS